jgi:hypothetical protein
MRDLSVIFRIVEVKHMFKKSLNKINPQSPEKKLSSVSYGPPIFAPDYSATGLAAKL